MGPHLGGSPPRWIPWVGPHLVGFSPRWQPTLYMIFFKLKLVLIDAIFRSHLFLPIRFATHLQTPKPPTGGSPTKTLKYTPTYRWLSTEPTYRWDPPSHLSNSWRWGVDEGWIYSHPPRGGYQAKTLKYTPTYRWLPTESTYRWLPKTRPT